MVEPDFAEPGRTLDQSLLDGVGPYGRRRRGQFAVDGSPMRLEFVSNGGKVSGIRLFRGARILQAVKTD